MLPDAYAIVSSAKNERKYFRPDLDYSWEELDKISAKVEGLWTWPMSGITWLVENGYEVHEVENFRL